MDNRPALPELAAILTQSVPEEKAAATRALAAWFCSTDNPDIGAVDPWPDPIAPAAPALLAPSEMPRRGLGSPEGRIGLLHAIAHIEFNAINLAIDMAGRFAHAVSEQHQNAFMRDWLGVADDEARHFCMVRDRLRALGSDYGALPAHKGLWQAAQRTNHDVLARLAIAPLVLEARGLDVTPNMIDGLSRVGDEDSADILRTIYEEEVGHVACGVRWFEVLCADQSLEPQAVFADFVSRYFPGGLKTPFNDGARAASGMPEDWYAPLA